MSMYCSIDSPVSEEEPEEWLPEEKTRGRGRRKKGEPTDMKPVTKRAAKPKESKPKELKPKESKPREPKPKAERKHRAPRVLKVKNDVDKEKGEDNNNNADFHQDESLPQVRVKEEVRLCVFCWCFVCYKTFTPSE